MAAEGAAASGGRGRRAAHLKQYAEADVASFFSASSMLMLPAAAVPAQSTYCRVFIMVPRFFTIHDDSGSYCSWPHLGLKVPRLPLVSAGEALWHLATSLQTFTSSRLTSAHQAALRLAKWQTDSSFVGAPPPAALALTVSSSAPLARPARSSAPPPKIDASSAMPPQTHAPLAGPPTR